MRAEDFAKLIDGKPGSGGWMARCPAHQDSTPSLSIKEGRDGVLVKCWAGCSLENILAALNLETKDLFYEDRSTKNEIYRAAPAGGSSHQAKRAQRGVTLDQLSEHVALARELLQTFHLADGTMRSPEGEEQPVVDVPYRSLDGSLQRVKHRTSLIGKPKYLWGPGEGTHLYGEWRLEDARSKGKLILCEGESDCWTLWALGAPALGVPGASNAGLLTLFHLDDIDRIWIVQDNDAAGERLVEELVARIDSLAPGTEARIVKPPQPFKDVSDWRKSFEVLGDFKLALAAAFADALTVSQLKSPLVKMSTVEEKAINFGWRPYLPEGYGTIMAGKPGHGKSFLTAKLAAIVSKGADGPCETKVVGPANVILMSSEDDIPSVILPRLRRAGADLDRVFCFDFERDEFMLGEEGAQRLDRYCQEHEPRVVILDPLVSFLDANVDMHRANEVRAAMKPIVRVARRHRVSLLVTAHIHKGEVAEAMDAVAGSIDFAAVVRSVLIVYRDPETPPETHNPRQAYVLAHAKHNLSAPGKGLRYEIKPCIDNPEEAELLWVGKSVYSADQLRRIKTDQLPAIEEAAAFLDQEIPPYGMAIKSILKKARAIGITKDDLEAARVRLGVHMMKTDEEEGGEWFWVRGPIDQQEQDN